VLAASERNAGQVMDSTLKLLLALRQLLVEVSQSHVLLKDELLQLGKRLDEVEFILNVVNLVARPAGQHMCENDHNKSDDGGDEDDYNGSTLVASEDKQTGKEKASS